MQNKLKPIVCQSCSGKGLLPSGEVCNDCRGIGATATDGTYEYYLGEDGKGGVRVVDVKQEVASQPQQNYQDNYPKEPTSPNQLKKDRTNVLRGLFFVLMIIVYFVVLALNFIVFKNDKLYWVVTVIFIGVVALFFIYNSKIIKKVMNVIVALLLNPPNDFETYFQKVKREKDKES